MTVLVWYHINVTDQAPQASEAPKRSHEVASPTFTSGMYCYAFYVVSRHPGVGIELLLLGSMMGGRCKLCFTIRGVGADAVGLKAVHQVKRCLWNDDATYGT